MKLNKSITDKWSNILRFVSVTFMSIFLPIAVYAQNEETVQLDNTDDVIVEDVDRVAEFPGGKLRLYEFLLFELKYPQYALENQIEGVVDVTFIVNKDGSLQNFSVSGDAEPILQEEALRLAQKMPHWVPARKNGEFCRSKFTLPIYFNVKR